MYYVTVKLINPNALFSTVVWTNIVATLFLISGVCELFSLWRHLRHPSSPLTNQRALSQCWPIMKDNNSHPPKTKNKLATLCVQSFGTIWKYLPVTGTTHCDTSAFLGLFWRASFISSLHSVAFALQQYPSLPQVFAALPSLLQVLFGSARFHRLIPSSEKLF